MTEAARRGRGGATAARAHHLIERAPDGPISSVNGRPRACAAAALRVISSRTRCHCFFVVPVNCYDFLWPKECVEL